MKDNISNTKEINAIDFLSSNRLDIVAKYLYVKFFIKKIDSNFGLDIYLSHIDSFNGFVENDESKKIGKDEFISTFNSLIESIKINGYDPDSFIPISKNNIILDGAHRIAASIYFDEKVNTVSTNFENKIFDYKFFKDMGLKEEFLDAMAYEYIKLKKNTFMVLVWPSAKGKDDELNLILKKYGEVVYRKNVFLNENGSINLIWQTYFREPWVGSYKDQFAGSKRKAAWCFNQEGPLRVILIESAKNLINMKDEIRQLYKIDKHAVHINDTKEETLELAGLLFNKNSIDWLNLSDRRDFKWFNKLFDEFKSLSYGMGKNIDNICIDGSAAMSAHGMRDCGDLDFLDFDPCGFEQKIPLVDCHNNNMSHHPVSRDEVIFNPKNHFILKGIKFISLNNLKALKMNRSELKDIDDVKRINNLVSGVKNVIPLSEKLRPLITLPYWKGFLRSILHKVRYHIYRFTKRDPR
jgi:hypothetical protein